MKVLCSNQTGTLFGWLAGRFPGFIGNLFSTDGKFTPWQFAPYALDNGAFPAWTKREPWNESAWLRLIDRAAACAMQPEWALVPDVVADKDRTIESWHRYAPRLIERGFKLAFAAQDGMRPGDVPDGAAVVFVGGTTEWKWRTMPLWCAAGYRVHVGRVNYETQLLKCYGSGAESTDGTGWFRGSDGQFNGLVRYLEYAQGAGVRPHAADLASGAAVQGSYFKHRDAWDDGGETQQPRLF